jgi:hypothetical protein
MRKRTLHTSINLLIEPGTYQRIKMIANLKKISMSKFIREGIRLGLTKYDKENNFIVVGEDYERSDSQETGK